MSKGNRMVGLAVKSSDRPERGSPECMLVHFDLGLTGLLFLTFFSFFFFVGGLFAFDELEGIDMMGLYRPRTQNVTSAG